MLLGRIRELNLKKEKPICIISAIFLVLILFLAVQILLPCDEYEFEGKHSFETGSVAGVTVYENISLHPGVYLINLEYETDTDLKAYCTVVDGTVFTGGLLTNGDYFYSALGSTNFAVWLFEGTKDLRVVIDFNGVGSLTTGKLIITETNQLWTLLLTIVVFAWLVISALLVFRYYDKKYSVSKEKKHTFFCVTVIGLIASIPYLYGYNYAGIDLTYHLQRIEGVKNGLLGGQFPVRIEPQWLFGYGYACAIFYCDLFLYFPAILRLLGFTVSNAYNIYCIALNLVTAWISYYCFWKMFGKRSVGIVCSALYTLSVYRFYKLLITSATGEGSGITFLPLVLYGLYRIFSEDPQDKKYKTAWIPVMIGYAGLFQSHVLSSEVTAVVTIIFCLIYIRKIFCKNTFIELLKAAGMAILVGLWFLVPIFDYYFTEDMHINNITAREIQSRGGYLAHQVFHFWHKGNSIPLGDNGMQYSYPEGVGMVLILVWAVFLILWFSGAFRKFEDARLTFGKVTASVGGLLLFMSLNIFPWDWIQYSNPIMEALVGSLEFPHRFLGWATVCMVAVFGYCMCYLEKLDKRFLGVLVAVAVFGVTTSSMYMLDDAGLEQDYYELYNPEGMGVGFISDGEFLVEGTDASLLTYTSAEAGAGVEISDYEKSYLNVSLRCENQTGMDSYVKLPLLLYKGYRAVVAQTGQKLQVFAGDNQELCVLIPAGFSGELQVGFVSPFYWRLAELVSLGTVVLLIVNGWRYRRKKYVQ